MSEFQNPAKHIMYNVWYSDGMEDLLTLNVFNGN